ncbi:MAG: MBL fold metallo-hydrolase [Planctomycetota bacterium]
MLFGKHELFTISDGTFKLDGGAMFGIVPKPLWNKLSPADSRNRITLALNCLLVRTGIGKNILIDTGLGTRYDEKSNDIYDINRNPGLEENLKFVGVKPEDIDFVILTHLHFDHCGGNVKLDSNGNLIPAFPNAKYIIQKKEWEDALNPNERTRGSYREDDLLPIEKAGQLQLIDGDCEVLPCIRTAVTGGHTRGHQVVIIESEGRHCIFWGDLIPTSGHINLPYVMSYDILPLDTIKEKKKWEDKVVSEAWLSHFEHDPKVTFAKLTCTGKRFSVTPVS